MHSTQRCLNEKRGCDETGRNTAIAGQIIIKQILFWLLLRSSNRAERSTHLKTKFTLVFVVLISCLFFFWVFYIFFSFGDLILCRTRLHLFTLSDFLLIYTRLPFYQIDRYARREREQKTIKVKRQPFCYSNDAHSYDYLMVPFRYLNVIFRSAPWFISDCSCYSFFFLSFFCHFFLLFSALSHYSQSIAHFTLRSVGPNAIIYINGRVC